MRPTILFLLFIFLFSCETNNNDDFQTSFKYQGDKKAQELINSGNEFGIDLFRIVLESDDCPENVMISPSSVAIALAMTYNGAEGNTKTAFENTLRHSGLSREEINDIYKALIDYLLIADPKVVFEIANSIWYKLNFNVLESFKKVNRDYYYAEVNELDFSKPDAVKTINDWAASKTHDKIQDVLDFIPGNVIMYLINALYFNGMWKYQFDEKNSFTADFYGESTYSAQYMENQSTYNYFENDLLSAIELPYGNGNFVMQIYLPKTKIIEDIYKELTPDNWKQWNALFNEQEVIVQLPKFKYDYKSLLNDPLIQMGLGVAFGSGADFSGISPGSDIFISRVIHQTFIDVNEKGTEAAAVTVVELREYAQPITMFTANKPFLYAIVEKNTASLLFMGKTGRPIYE